MSKTFESVVGEDTEVLVRSGGGIFIAIRRGGETRQATTLDSADAPALCLAILEAAGVVPTMRDYYSYDDGTQEHLEAVAHFLKQHNEAQARATAEAKDREQLEAEAKELRNAWFNDMLDESPPSSKWLAVATKARELAENGEMK